MPFEIWESDTYLAIFEEGRLIQARKNVLSLGDKRFGPPDDLIKMRVEAMTDLDHFGRIHCRLLDARDWQDLLDTP